MESGSTINTMKKLWIILIPLIAVVFSATSGEIKVGKVWVEPYITNYGYLGDIEYPGGSSDYYILQLSMMFSCDVNGEEFILFGGSVGQYELEYGLQNADGMNSTWTQTGDDRSFTELTATSNFVELSSNLTLDHTTTLRAYNTPAYDDFILITHVFENTGALPVENFNFGYHMPADVGASGVMTKELDDHAAYNSDLGLAYMFDDNGDNGVTPFQVGQALLDAPLLDGNPVGPQRWNTFNYYLMVNPIVGKADLKEKLTRGIIEADTESKGPYTVISGVGPYTILPGASLSFTVALIYGNGQNNLFQNTENAEALIAGNFIIPPDELPPMVPIVDSIDISGRVVYLEWDNDAAFSSDFAGYRVYRSVVSAIGTWDVIAELTGSSMDNSYLDLDVQIGFPNYYAISSFDLTGNETGIWSNLCRSDGNLSTADIDPVIPMNNPGTSSNQIRVVPNPYIGGANWERQDFESTIYFTHLPERCSIYIHSLTGEKITRLDHNMGSDLTLDDSGDESWDLLSSNNQKVTSGLYLYRIVSPDREEHVGRFVIIRGEK